MDGAESSSPPLIADAATAALIPSALDVLDECPPGVEQTDVDTPFLSLEETLPPSKDTYQLPDQSGLDWERPADRPRGYTHPPLQLARVSPLKADRFLARAASHPNQDLVCWVADGAAGGFDDGSFVPEGPATTCKNMNSAFVDEGSHLDKYYDKEVADGRCAVVSDHCHPCARIQPVGTAERVPYDPRKLSKIRPTKNLTAPGADGFSVNGTIDLEEHPLKFITPWDIALVILFYSTLSTQVCMSAFDIEKAFRNLPLKPELLHLHLIKWRGQVLADLVLSFGGASSCFLFSSVMIVVCYIIQQELNAQLGFIPGTNVPVAIAMFYMDDLGVVASSIEAGLACGPIICAVLRDLGLPNSEEKMKLAIRKGPWLGLLFDCVNLEVDLPPDKLEAYAADAKKLEGPGFSTRAQYLKYGGRFNFATAVHPWINCFISEIWALAYSVPKDWHRKDHSPRVRLDAKIIATVLKHAPRRPMSFASGFKPNLDKQWPIDPPEYEWFAVGDASGATGLQDGFGFFTRRGHVAVPWKLDQRLDLAENKSRQTSSLYIETFCFVTCVCTMLADEDCRGVTIHYFTDCQCLAKMWLKGRTGVKIANDLVRSLTLALQIHDVSVEVHWRRRTDPYLQAADALSHCVTQDLLRLDALPETAKSISLTPAFAEKVTSDYVGRSLTTLLEVWRRRRGNNTSLTASGI